MFIADDSSVAKWVKTVSCRCASKMNLEFLMKRIDNSSDVCLIMNFHLKRCSLCIQRQKCSDIHAVYSISHFTTYESSAIYIESESSSSNIIIIKY